MSFLGDLMQAVKKTAEQAQTGELAMRSSSSGGGIGGGGGKKPECTPCAAGAYVDGLRDFARGKPKKTTRRKKK